MSWKAAAVIVRDGDGACLLLQRGDTAPWMPGRWNLPGGVQDAGETLEETARRETLEETGLTVGVLTLVAVVRYPDDGELRVYQAQEFAGEVQLCWESKAMAWAHPKEIHDFDLVPGLFEVLR